MLHNGIGATASALLPLLGASLHDDFKPNTLPDDGRDYVAVEIKSGYWSETRCIVTCAYFGELFKNR